MNNKVSTAEKAVLYMFLTVLAFVALFPILYIAVSSFKSNSEILAHPEWILPRKFTFDNYIQVWKSDYFDFKRMTFNSLVYTLVCVAINIFVSCGAAYAFVRGQFRLKKVIFVMFSSIMFVSMGGVTIYPMFDVLNAINLNRGLYGLMIVKLFTVPIINIYLVKGYIQSLPYEIEEAATIDGCSFTSIFFRIIMPLIKPIVATVAILSFQGSWNEYLLPTIFTQSVPAQRTLIVGIVALKSSGEAASSWNLMLAGSTLTVLPILIAYMIGNRYFISGLASGAVKG